jgi:hypothetical protein
MSRLDSLEFVGDVHVASEEEFTAISLIIGTAFHPAQYRDTAKTEPEPFHRARRISEE